jgi:hypothetical protein
LEVVDCVADEGDEEEENQNDEEDDDVALHGDNVRGGAFAKLFAWPGSGRGLDRKAGRAIRSIILGGKLDYEDVLKL